MRDSAQAVAPLADMPTRHTADEQSELREKRRAARQAKQDAARVRREQSAAAKRR